MSSLKMSVLCSAAAAAFFVIGSTGTASATILCNADCTETYPAGTSISAQLTEGPYVLEPPIGTIKCEESTLGAKTTNSGGATETVNANTEALSFTKCNATVTVLAKGTLTMHKDPSGKKRYGTLTGSGAELTVVYLGFHCIFKTSATHLGTFDPVDLFQNHPPTLTGNGKTPRTGGSSGAFCGSEAGWSGHYEVTAPFSLSVE